MKRAGHDTENGSNENPQKIYCKMADKLGSYWREK
jgi:hypothetical protein